MPRHPPYALNSFLFSASSSLGETKLLWLWYLSSDYAIFKEQRVISTDHLSTCGGVMMEELAPSKLNSQEWKTKKLRINLDELHLEKTSILRKEVIQPQVPLRLPCYDFTPIATTTLVCYLRS